MQMLLFPGYVSLASARTYSPRLFRVLKEREVPIEVVRWDGTTSGVPTKHPVIIRASTKMMCDPADLASIANQHGHFVYYDDKVLLPNGSFTSDQLEGKLIEFLDRNGFSA